MPTGILVIDDAPQQLSETSHILQSAGFTVIKSSGGRAAVEAAAEHNPDLILLAANPEDINRIAVVKQLKSVAAPQDNMLIALISDATAASANGANMCPDGVDDSIARPFSHQAFLERIRLLLRLKRSEAACRRLETKLDQMSTHSQPAIMQRHQMQTTLHQTTKSIEQLVGNRTALLQRTNTLLTQEIAERRETEEALRASEARYRTLVETMNEGLIVADADIVSTYANDKIQTLLGYLRDEILGRPLTDFCDEQNAVIVKNQFGRRKRSDRGSYEVTWTHKDGHRIPTILADSPIFNAERLFIGSFAVITDISKRKQIEKNLQETNTQLWQEHRQRKLLSKKLIDLLENSRRQIAMELHDHIGQQLTSFKIALEVFHDQLVVSHPELALSTRDIEKKVAQLLQDVRSISHGLMPSMLDTLGLIPSLRELFNTMKLHKNLEINFFNRNISKRFNNEKELAIYRITQEALNNIIRHAQAQNVFVNLIQNKGFISLSVEDDGIGFDHKQVLEPSGSRGTLGVLIMRERAMQRGGEFTIESQPGKGTHIVVEIPI